MVNKLTRNASGLPACPKCKSPENAPCVTRSGNIAKAQHQARWALYFDGNVFN